MVKRFPTEQIHSMEPRYIKNAYMESLADGKNGPRPRGCFSVANVASKRKCHDLSPYFRR